MVSVFEIKYCTRYPGIRLWRSVIWIIYTYPDSRCNLNDEYATIFYSFHGAYSVNNITDL
jgi:hypothetical protein